MKISGIYKIINKVNGKYYVGSSTDILTDNIGRWYRHKHDLRKNIHRNDYLQRAWNKYGESNFDFIIVEQVPKHQLLVIEQKYLDIAILEKDKCYNLMFESGLGSPCQKNEYSRLKMINSLKEYYKNHKHPMQGRTNSFAIDKSIYKLFNTESNETFEGTHFDFKKKYKIKSMSPVINGRRNHHKKWRLIFY
jgi:group I intron endonuclease